MSRRRCELEQAQIRAMVHGDRAWLNTLGEQDWEREKELNMADEQIYDLNHYRDLSHVANVSWWPEDKKTRNQGQLLMLCVSELSEALEGHRKGLSDDKLPHRAMVEVELVDFLIRAFDMAGGMGWDLTIEDDPKYPITGNGLNDIAFKARNWNHTQRVFGDTLMIITGFLVDCYRYRQFGEKQAANLKRAIHMALALGRDMGLDLQGAYDEKQAFNRVRADHQKEHREAAGGKKY